MMNLNTRTRKAVAALIALFAVVGLGLGNSMAGWVDDAKVLTPIQSSFLDFQINGLETDTVPAASISSGTTGIAPGQYQESNFETSMMSSDNATMPVDVTVEVEGVPTPFAGLSYAITSGNTAEEDYSTLKFSPLVNTSMGSVWLSVPGNASFIDIGTNVTPDGWNGSMATMGNLKVVFKADGDLEEGSTVTPEFRLITTQRNSIS